MGGLVDNILPSFLHLNSTSDVVGFNLQNVTDASLASSYTSFGQEFAQGTLTSGQSLTATIMGVRQEVQVDPKTFYSDGSVEMAVLTLLQPTIAARSTAQGLLSVSNPITIPNAVDVSQVLAGHSQSVELSFADGSGVDVDIGRALQNALVDGTASKWISGPNATQIGTTINVSSSLRLVITATAYADDTFKTSVTFANDLAMGPTGGAMTFSTSITQDGQLVYSQPMTTVYQYQDFTADWSNSGVSLSALNVQHDPAYLEQVHAIPDYDLSSGVSQSVLDNEAQSISSATWDQPLSNNALTPYMPTTGGRGDIGPTTLGNAVWLVTQDPIAATFALGQAKAAQSVPWNIWDPGLMKYVDTDVASDIWTDGRGGSGSYTTGLTQQIDQAGSGWTLDSAHQPDLSYYAYLLTGDQQYLATLNAQAAWSISSTWPGARGTDGLLVVGPNNQVRGSAWSLREIDEASYANPDGSAEKAYFTHIADANWSWLVSQIPSWTVTQGQAFGQVEGTYGGGSGNIHLPPWEQDYFASTAIQAAQHGNADALTFLTWESNFLVGRFLNGSNGFNPHDGVAYNIVVGNNNTIFSSWSDIGNATAAANESNGAGWAQSNGDYAQLALESLAGIISLTGSQSAIEAYNFLIKSGAPQIDATSLSEDFQFDIVPKLQAGLAFAADGTITSVSTSIATQPLSPTSNTNNTSDPVGTSSTTTNLPPASSPTAPASTDAGLIINVSEDAYKGDAQFTVTVDGQQYGGVYTATASHNAGSSQPFAVGPLDAGTHQIGISFINDLYDGSPQTDRNLYLDSATYNGQSIANTNQTLSIDSTANFTALGDRQATSATTNLPPASSPTAPASTDAGLIINVSEDAYKGDAQFTVTVDGQQYGGVYTAIASHNAGSSQPFAVGPLDAGTHQIGISFINDLYDGSPQTDRNLYLDSATYNGQSIANTNQTLSIDSTANFTALGDRQATSATTNLPPASSPTAPASTDAGLIINVSEDAYKGDAQFTVTVDGQQYGGVYTATASHNAGSSQPFAVGPLDAGTHQIGISFINDLYDGSPQTDRNLYLDSATYNGQSIANTNQTLSIDSTANFTALGDRQATSATTNLPPASSPTAPASTDAGLIINVSEDAYKGDAQFTVTVDGQQYGGVYTATASHNAGSSQPFAVGPLDAGTHQIGISFINDLYDGSPQTDRNLYLDSATYNGQSIANTNQTLSIDSTANFTALGDRQATSATTNLPPASSPTAPASTDAGLIINVSEDAYKGDAQFTVTVDGQQYGGVYTATASHNAGSSQPFAVGPLDAGTHQIGISFINDLYDGSPQTDRNLYLDSATYNGQSIANTNQTLSIDSTANFTALGDRQATSATTNLPPASSPTAPASTDAGLIINVSEDAYKGDAQFTVTVDGQQYGGVYTATASHNAGSSQPFAVGPLDAGTHQIGISFINDLYDGSPQTDRNLYLDSAHYNGHEIAGGAFGLYTDTTQSLIVLASPN